MADVQHLVHGPSGLLELGTDEVEPREGADEVVVGLGFA